MATVSQHIVKLACSDLYFLSESSPGDVDASWGLGIGRPPGATQDRQQGRCTRLREDGLRLKEERREEVQIVSDSQVTVRPKVKTETSERDESIVAGFNPLFNSSVIKEPPTSGKISSTGLRNAPKKVLPGSSVPTQPAEGPTPSPGDQDGLVAFS